MSIQRGRKLLRRFDYLFPYISQNFILHKKIDYIHRNKKDLCQSFTFFRCFIPYYYDMLNDIASNHRALKPLDRALGNKDCFSHCMGDAHPENFGMVYNNTHDETFITMNDGDDGGQEYLYRDFLRFLSSIQLYDKSINLKPLIKSYERGLKGKKCRFSNNAVEAVKDAMDKEKKETSKDYEDKYYEQKKEKEEEEYGYNMHHVELSDWEEKRIAEIVEELFGKAMKFEEGYTYVKVVGGSGGLRRYRMLVSFKDKDKPSKPNSAKKGIMELKELTVPGVYPGAYFTRSKIGKCIEENLTFAQGQPLGDFYNIVKFDKSIWEFRPRWNKYKGVKLAKLEKDEIPEVLSMEAHILGGLHRRSAKKGGKINKYLKALKKVDNKDWINAAEYLRKRVTRDYNDLVDVALIKPVKKSDLYP
ncbi:DUF2252 family protein [Magnetococcales bacterium HHB-1]